jgi:predicted transcriptional regulator
LYGTPKNMLVMGQCPEGALPLINRFAFPGEARLDGFRIRAYFSTEYTNHIEVNMSVSSAIQRLVDHAIATEALVAEEAAIKPISVRLPESLVLLLDNIARELHTSRSDVMHTILANGAEDAAQVLAESFASESDRAAYFRSLHSSIGFESAQADGGNN